MGSLRSGKPTCAPPRLSEVSPTLLNSSYVRLIDNGPLSSFQRRSSSVSPFYASFLQAIDGVMSLALCLQVESEVQVVTWTSEAVFRTKLHALSTDLYLGLIWRVASVETQKSSLVFRSNIVSIMET